MNNEKLIRDIVANVMSKLEAGVSQDIAVSGREVEGEVKPSDKKIVCGASVRHVHLCREHVDVLFGKDYQMQVLKELYQPGTYAYRETVTIVGPKLNAIQNVRILGPLRDRSQVELAKTDCVILGIDAPVRASGDLAGSSSAVIIGPKGAVYLAEGVIRANRHIHLSTEDASYFGLKDNDRADVRVSGPKGLTFNNVQVRVSPDFKSEMHIDTDDANAADIVNGTLVEIVDASCISPIISPIVDSGSIPPQIPDNSFSGEIADANILKRINNVLPEESKTKEMAGIEGAGVMQKNKEVKKKIVITVDDLDEYKESGITVTGNVILSPLARDEAIKKGIKISYDK